MTHPTGWTLNEPCPSCGSPDILECEIRVSAEQIQMGWECRDCGHGLLPAAYSPTTQHQNRQIPPHHREHLAAFVASLEDDAA